MATKIGIPKAPKVSLPKAPGLPKVSQPKPPSVKTTGLSGFLNTAKMKPFVKSIKAQQNTSY